MDRIFTLINGDTMYNVFGVTRTEYDGVCLLLQTRAGNWIVANGAHITTAKNDVHMFRVAFGDWSFGHYFMGDKSKALDYFEYLKEMSA